MHKTRGWPLKKCSYPLPELRKFYAKYANFTQNTQNLRKMHKMYAKYAKIYSKYAKFKIFETFPENTHFLLKERKFYAITQNT